MKKLLCVVLSALMLSSVLPMTVFAADGATDQSDTSVCYIEDGETKTYYDSLTAAIKAITKAGLTIYMIKDSASEPASYAAVNYDVTVEGNNFAVTGEGVGRWWIYSDKGADVTIKNITINSGMMLAMNGGADGEVYTLENCVLNSTCTTNLSV